jgi:acyl-coenzyme A thioesterase PaaI-like protein
MADDEVNEPWVARWANQAAEISPRRAEMRRLAEAGRVVIERLATTDAPHEVIEAAASLLEEAAATLEGARKTRSYDGFAEAGPAGGDEHAHLDHSPIMGKANPIAPDARIEWGGDRVFLYATFGSAYEGPPGSVHGGWVAATFDEVLGMAQSMGGQPGMTGTLSIKYRKPTPLHRELRFEGTLDRVDGRKIFTTGRCYDGDTLTAEAEGLFIRVDFQKIAAMMTERNEGA